MIDLQYIPPYFQNYIKWVDDLNVTQLLSDDKRETMQFLESIPDTKFDFSYGIKKWTLKQVLQHLIDVERIFAYRALCFSRNDSAELHSFDQHDYLTEANIDKVGFNDLVAEWASVRGSTIHFFNNLHKPYLSRVGRAGGLEFSVQSIGFIIVGHNRHHLKVIKEKYL